MNPTPTVCERSVNALGASWPFDGVRGITSVFDPDGSLTTTLTADELNGSDRVAAIEFDVVLDSGAPGRLRTIWCFHLDADAWIPVGAHCGFDRRATDWPWPIN